MITKHLRLMLVVAKTLYKSTASFARLVNYKIVSTGEFGRYIAINLFGKHLQSSE